MSIDDYYISRITLNRLESVFQNGYMSVLELISKSPEFFNKSITADELYKEFVEEPVSEIKEEEKINKEINHINNNKSKQNKLEKHQRVDHHKCHALIHLKREFRQCQNIQLSDDDFCPYHSKMTYLPYGRVNFYDDNDDENDS
jgi:hypothetical protein